MGLQPGLRLPVFPCRTWGHVHLPHTDPFPRRDDLTSPTVSSAPCGSVPRSASRRFSAYAPKSRSSVSTGKPSGAASRRLRPPSHDYRATPLSCRFRGIVRHEKRNNCPARGLGAMASCQGSGRGSLRIPMACRAARWDAIQRGLLRGCDERLPGSQAARPAPADWSQADVRGVA